MFKKGVLFWQIYLLKKIIDVIFKKRRKGIIVDDEMWQDLYDSCDSFKKMAEGHAWAMIFKNEKWEAKFLVGMKNFAEEVTQLRSLLKNIKLDDPDWGRFAELKN